MLTWKICRISLPTNANVLKKRMNGCRLLKNPEPSWHNCVSIICKTTFLNIRLLPNLHNSTTSAQGQDHKHCSYKDIMYIYICMQRDMTMICIYTVRICISVHIYIYIYLVRPQTAHNVFFHISFPTDILQIYAKVWSTFC